MFKSTIQRRPRVLASVAAAALVGSGLTFLGTAPAQAADETIATGSTLKWGVSQYLTEHLLGQTFTDGATKGDGGVVTFVNGQGRTDTRTHETTVTYDGTARYAFAMAGKEYYSVAFSDLTVEVGADGEGELQADIRWEVDPTSGTAEDVTLATFSTTDESWDGFTLSAVPDWAGVAEPGQYGTVRGKPAPDATGGSWAPDFIGNLHSDIIASFFASGSTSDSKKPPAAFTAQAPAPSTTVTTTKATAEAFTLGVTGRGFTAVTEADDAGVYVGIAESGGLPDVSEYKLDGFVAAAPVFGASFPGGAFSTTLNAATDKLDPAKSYSVYTWQAHTHSNTTQDTETPVTLDWASTISVSKPAIKGTSKVGGTLSVTAGTVTAPVGTATSVQWLANGKAIAGATKSTLALTPALVGKSITATKTATFAGAKSVATSSAVKVALGTQSGIKAPKVTGKAKVGKKLTASVKVPAGAKASYQWYSNGKAIKGAKAKSLKLKKAQKGKKVTVKVTITKSGYAKVAKTSAKTAKVRG